MKHWRMISELTAAAGAQMFVAVFVLLAIHVHQRVGVSTVFVAAVLLATLGTAVIVTFFWDFVADLLRWSGRTKTAEAVLKDSLARWQTLVGETGAGVAFKIGHLADFYLELGRADQAEQLYKRIANRWRPSLAAMLSPATASLERYAGMLASRGRQEESKEVRKLIGGSRITRLLPALCGFGLTLLVIAYLLLTQVLQSAIANYPPDDAPKLRHDYIDDLARIERIVLGPRAGAAIYFSYGMRQFGERADPREAEWALRNALDGLRSDRRANKLYLAQVLNRLAGISFAQGQLQEAEALYRESVWLDLGRDLGAGGEADAARTEALLGMARICQSRRQSPAAEAYFEKALKAARGVYGPDSGDAIDALLGLAEARQHNGDSSKAEALLNDAIERAEKSFRRIAQSGKSAKDERDRLVIALILKSQVLRAGGRNAEADAIEKQVDEIQWSRRPQVKLNEQLQAQIVDTVQSATGWLLSIKYATRQRDEGRTKLSESLTAEARSHLARLPWYSGQANISQVRLFSAAAPDAVEPQFGQISVRSPDSDGLLTIEVRGRPSLHIHNKSVSGEPFAFAYRIRPPAANSRHISIEDVEELSPVSTLD